MFQLGSLEYKQKSGQLRTPGRALFLDRDGVINVDHGYVHKAEHFDFCEGIFDLVSSANSAGYRVLVVTNQAGIARGYYTEDDFRRLSLWMLDEFRSRDCVIDQVYFSPFHPSEGKGVYRCDHPTRKPRPGMFLKAFSDWHLSPRNSLLIGDKETDIEAASKAGISCTLLYRPDGLRVMNTRAQSQITDLRSADVFL